MGWGAVMSEATPPTEGEPTPLPVPTPPLPVPSPPALPPGVSDRFSRLFPSGTGFASLRDLILFIVGLGVIGQQVYFAEAINSVIVGVGATMAGLPIVFRADKSSK